MTPRKRIVRAGAALILAASLAACGLPSVTKSSDQASYYFRLKADYSHEGQPVNFDIVVACGIRVDRYRSGDSGFLAARYPRFFVKETHDGHAVMQIVPIACRGETTANGIVPKDFLPGVIWFERPGDYRFGIAYVSEDAFENPNGQLKFHGASIEKATHEDWKAFQKSATNNEGLRARYYDRPYYTTEEALKIARAGGEEIEPAFARGCSGNIRIKLSEAGRAILRKYWSAEKPRFWAGNSRDEGPWPELIETGWKTPVFDDGFHFKDRLNWNNYKYGGFPTRARGGMMYSKHQKTLPSEIYPARMFRGIPWVFTEEVVGSKYLTRDVEVDAGPGKGFLYCYTNLNPTGGLEIQLPDFRSRESRVRVDGQWVVTPKPKNWSWPLVFYERDEFMYIRFGIGLS